VVSEPDRTRFDEDTEPAGAFRLRSEAPPVMRLSRRVLTGLVGIGAIVIFGALIRALSGQQKVRRRVGTLPHGQQDDARRPYQPAAGLWRSHPGQAAAGDPRPAFARRRRSASTDARSRRSRTPAPCAGKRGSALEPSLRHHRHAGAAGGGSRCGHEDGPGQGEAAPLDPGALLNMQDRKLAFVKGAVDRKTVSPDHLENPVSRYVAVPPSATGRPIRRRRP
jgi:type IV secretion system protein TrbI